jgi:hypothetical protein
VKNLVKQTRNFLFFFWANVYQHFICTSCIILNVHTYTDMNQKKKKFVKISPLMKWSWNNFWMSVAMMSLYGEIIQFFPAMLWEWKMLQQISNDQIAYRDWSITKKKNIWTIFKCTVTVKIKILLFPCSTSQMTSRQNIRSVFYKNTHFNFKYFFPFSHKLYEGRKKKSYCIICVNEKVFLTFNSSV